jgi:hypothetical protein
MLWDNAVKLVYRRAKAVVPSVPSEVIAHGVAAEIAAPRSAVVVEPPAAARGSASVPPSTPTPDLWSRQRNAQLRAISRQHDEHQRWHRVREEAIEHWTTGTAPSLLYYFAVGCVLLGARTQRRNPQ